MKTALVIASLFVTAPVAFGETVVLKNGAEISGMLVERQDKNAKDAGITIRVAGGEITIAESAIRETRKDPLTAEALKNVEEDAKSKAAIANRERLERMTLAAADFDLARREVAQVQSASFRDASNGFDLRSVSREKSVEEIGADIEAKLELLRDFERRGLSNRTGFQEQQRLRRAILDELFPTQRSEAVVW